VISTAQAVSTTRPDEQDNAELALTLEQRAYDAVVQPYKAVKVYDYFLEHWLPLLGASRALLVIAYRQLAFVVRSRKKSGEEPVRVTLRQLGRWCGQVHRQVRKLHQSPGYLTWFVRPAVGSLGEHPGARSERRILQVRVAIPLTPADQLRLRLFLEANRPEEDSAWAGVLHRALEAKEIDLDDTMPLPDSPATIQEIVRALRGSDGPLPDEIEDACIELHERWITENHLQATHYFLLRWLPDLPLGLGMAILWLRRRAQRAVQRTEVGQVRLRSLSQLAEVIGVSTKTASRWIAASGESYAQACHFILEAARECELTGWVEGIEPEAWTIAGKRVAVLSGARIASPIQIGDFVSVRMLRRRDSSLVATRIQPAHEVRDPQGLREIGWLLDIRLSDPIHARDMERYRSVRLLPHAEHSALSSEEDPTGEAESISSTHWPLPENRDGTKVPSSETKVSKAPLANSQGTKYPNSPTSVSNPPTEVPRRRTEVSNRPTEVSSERSGVPALRVLKSQINPSQEESSEDPPQQQPPVVVVSSQDWHLDTILEQGAVPRRDRSLIAALPRTERRNFVGWLLYGMAQESIRYPVLHAVRRVLGDEDPPGEYHELAQIPPSVLWRWLDEPGYSDDAPRELDRILDRLRAHEGRRRLLELGAVDPPPVDGGMLVSDPENDTDDGHAEPPGESLEQDVPILRTGKTALQIWKAAVNQLQLEMPRAIFDTWVRDTELLGFEDGVFVIGVQNDYARDWLEDRVRTTAERVLTGVVGYPVRVRFVAMEGE